MTCVFVRHPLSLGYARDVGNPDPRGRTCTLVPVPVEVRLPTLLRPHAGGAASVTAEGGSVADVFADLAARYPGLSDQLVDDSGSIHKFVNVYRNDDDVRYLEQLDTKVTDGDVISILPAVAGG
jgi:molybdopterin synthase sulfur carrier subunit